MATVYDYQPSARDDPLVHIVENALISALEVMTPGRAALLNTFPFCKLSTLSHGVGDPQSNAMLELRPIA